MREILESLGVGAEVPVLEVWNKIDLLSPDDRDAAEARATREEGLFAVSALDGAGLPALLTAIAELLQDARARENLVLGYHEGRKRAWLFDQDVVLAERQGDDGFEFDVRWTAIQKARFEGL